MLTARYIGHKPITRTVALTGGEQQQDFQLAADPLRLEEVVVTGVAEATDRRKLPMTVATVGTDQLQAVPGGTALQAVEGKVAGVRLIPNSAQPGGEPVLRLRGATSIGGRQVRVRLSTFGASGLVVGAAHIALSAGGSAVIPGSDRPLTFGGKPSIAIPPGAPR